MRRRLALVPLAAVLVAAAPLAPRADDAPPSLQTFKLTPQKPLAQLLRLALAARPPVETGKRPAELVELVTLDPTIALDIRYATRNNFMGEPFYSQARAFLQRPAAAALVRANAQLRAHGYGILVHDGYRPWYVTKMFWEATDMPDKARFLADPAQGSRHNRGCAVDVSLYERKSGREVRMPSGYDEMSQRAFAEYAGGTPEERQRRDLLRAVMEHEGFIVNPNEWWHFDYRDWQKYPILNIPFEQLAEKHR